MDREEKFNIKVKHFQASVIIFKKKFVQTLKILCMSLIVSCNYFLTLKKARTKIIMKITFHHMMTNVGHIYKKVSYICKSKTRTKQFNFYFFLSRNFLIILFIYLLFYYCLILFNLFLLFIFYFIYFIIIFILYL